MNKIEIAIADLKDQIKTIEISKIMIVTELQCLQNQLIYLIELNKKK